MHPTETAKLRLRAGKGHVQHCIILQSQVRGLLSATERPSTGLQPTAPFGVKGKS